MKTPKRTYQTLYRFIHREHGEFGNCWTRDYYTARKIMQEKCREFGYMDRSCDLVDTGMNSLEKMTPELPKTKNQDSAQLVLF